MFKTLFDFLLNRKGHPVNHDTPTMPDAPVAPAAPAIEVKTGNEYVATKIEPMKCGCGRSQTGYCVGLHKLTAEEWSVHADNPNKAPAKKPRVGKSAAAAAKAADAKKPAAMKAPAKPRAKKAKE